MRRTAPSEAAALRAAVAEDIPAIDTAARAWTGLGVDLPATRIRVVSRDGWVAANLVGLRGALAPIEDRLGERRLARPALSVQLGGLFGLLSTKVLGQFVLPLGGPGQAQLVIVGPNVLELSERYGPLATDVRRTVLLHELTHRLQFDAVPWLGDHLRGILVRYLEASRVDPSAVLAAIGRLPDAVRALREDRDVTPLMTIVLTDEQREIVDEAQALMTLLEGHGTAVMYAAADGLVSDPPTVRDALERSRSDWKSRVLGAVAGIEMKRRQYQKGETFVREVVEAAGVDGLNRAFARPETLPTLDEIADAPRWLDRVGVDR